MKKIKKFVEGEEIPENSKYLFSFPSGIQNKKNYEEIIFHYFIVWDEEKKNEWRTTTNR